MKSETFNPDDHEPLELRGPEREPVTEPYRAKRPNWPLRGVVLFLVLYFLWAVTR